MAHRAPKVSIEFGFVKMPFVPSIKPFTWFFVSKSRIKEVKNVAIDWVRATTCAFNHYLLRAIRSTPSALLNKSDRIDAHLYNNMYIAIYMLQRSR